MAALAPRTEHEFHGIHGVGKHKLDRYGPLFLDEIRQFREQG
jgi:superfamily II DNA helicase RecQ